MINTLEYYNPLDLEALDCIAPVEDIQLIDQATEEINNIINQYEVAV